jgi:translation initiation factor 2 subunit 3
VITFAKKSAHGKKETKLLPEVNIGMVGHVDHGKTTLTQSLTGKWTDTHSEEIKRGITIRLGYADATFYKCPKCKGENAFSSTDKCIKCFSVAKPLRTVSFIDAPGHETLMTTVLSGSAIMDGALLLISANEKCPQPQTREHLIALDIAGIKNIVVVQNKIDLVSKEEAQKNYQEIKAFLKGSIAEDAPIIPVSAQHNLNIDALIEAIETGIPTPKRDPKKEPRMYVARSFDINKPGTSLKELKGGILGGSLVEGELKEGEEVEVRPGTRVKGKFQPVTTKITGLQKSFTDIKKADPGGLLGVSTSLDPSLTKSDSLTGNILGIPGKLPPVYDEITFHPHLFPTVVGSKEEAKVDHIKVDDPLMLTVGISRTVGLVASVHKSKVTVSLKIPVCADKKDRIAISRQVMGRWRLIGWAELV